MASTPAQAATCVRRELKAAFPFTTFTVKSRSYSMGSAVDIDWTDGPLVNAVDRIVRKYEYGHFDGMIDLYEYSNCRDDIPQVKFVMTQRDQSKDTRQSICDYLNNHRGWAMELDQYGCVIPWTDASTGNGWRSHELNRVFADTSLICQSCGFPIQFNDQYCPEWGHNLKREMQ